MSTIEQILLQGTRITYEGPDPQPILGDGTGQNFPYKGTIRVTAESYGGLTIGKEYLSPTGGLNILISAERVGPIFLIANRSVCAVTIVEVNASVPSLSYESACEPGGAGVHRVFVQDDQPLPVRILKQGTANFFNFDLFLTGEHPGDLRLTQPGNAIRISDEVTEFEGQTIRLITISTRLGV